MWKCAICNTEVEDDSWEECWQCSNPRHPSPQAEPAQAPAPNAARGTALERSHCLRCHTRMRHMGTKEFHEGARYGAMGDLAELFVEKQSYEVYACTRCGKVEFFLGVDELLALKEDEPT